MSDGQSFDSNYFKVLTRYRGRTEVLSVVSMEVVAQCGAFFRPMFFDHVENKVKIAEVWSIVDGRFFVVSSRQVTDEDSIFREKSLGLCKGFINI